MKYKVPIKNVYIMLCYTYEMLELVPSLVSVDEDLPNTTLLEKLLYKSIQNLFDNSIKRQYKLQNYELPTIQGKILFNESIPLFANKRPRIVCESDELNSDILLNQIIKATLSGIIHSSNSSLDSKEEAFYLLEKLKKVRNIKLNQRHFLNIRLNRTTIHYEMPLNIARLLYELQLLSNESGNINLLEVINNDQKMQKIFEKFLLNFYRLEQKVYFVKSERLNWIISDPADISLLPIMQTDICLLSKEKKIIIDAKYYRKALVKNFEKMRIRSNHLYQLYAYINQSNNEKITEGILIYPFNGYHLNEKYHIPIKVGSTILRSSISVVTIDLTKKWNDIHRNLLEIIS